ncbi:MAG: hypothetical protein CMF39_02660 [Legionellaceae bacterium]|nr:hypothetical protein [Legionellaceae bacterium]|tara:strand:- start:117 stop:416 length:300 start_codon:yes stop_codon:yes gene_type:complete
MAWNIVYAEHVETWLDKLDNTQLKSVAKELCLLEMCGNELKLPHSKSLGRSLFELRERKFGLRIYYAFNETQDIVLLVAGNKQTQQRDIRKARQLLKTV